MEEEQCARLVCMGGDDGFICPPLLSFHFEKRGDPETNHHARCFWTSNLAASRKRYGR